MFGSDDTCTGDGDVESLQQIYEGLLNRVRAARKISVAELLSAINSSEFTLNGNFSVEHFVPNYARGRETEVFHCDKVSVSLFKSYLTFIKRVYSFE